MFIYEIFATNMSFHYLYLFQKIILINFLLCFKFFFYKKNPED